ncbi:class II glutamine amidotransferase [Croceicoccus naphthovorans]|uniref:Amidotransfease n=1 Tax=Croceicoccus naphthovorans TaxID=1348774 RepID=A0A0G3XER7_9SPHN|nr:class II glutamine amidotransferase [Croceicoccus naphthovorans]AKM09084.1 amidotransfease [Croceicoccus naphthovorans]MBB3991676.1 glutamine amidotransferase [Croceicoccus naphthovorans]
MCELFAMNSAGVAKVTADLDAFAREGGERNLNRDGWGIVFAEQRDAHVFREAAPAANSALAKMVFEREFASSDLIAHVRRASQGNPLLANTHPFTRVRGGMALHFAHNGDLDGIAHLAEAESLLEERIGDTDSELAFLILLRRLDGSGQDDTMRFDLFAGFCADMRELGTANFLFYDGRSLFIHADRRRSETPEGTISEPREPGLVMRHFGDCDDIGHWHGKGPRIRNMPPRTRLFASVPLDDDEWEPLPRGTAMMLRDGAVLGRTIA